MEDTVMEIDELGKTAAVPIEEKEPDNSVESKEPQKDTDSQDDHPGCLFYSCFACENGYCMSLNDADFHGRPCSFFKTRAQAKKDQQDSFDRLLIDGRLDVINRYENILVDLGIENPEDAGEGPLRLDDDVLAARKEMGQFQMELGGSDRFADTGDADTTDNTGAESGKSEDVDGRENSGGRDAIEDYFG